MELNCLVTAFDKPDILFGDYFCLVSYISSDGHFLVVYSLVLLSGDSSLMTSSKLVRCAEP